MRAFLGNPRLTVRELAASIRRSLSHPHASSGIIGLALLLTSPALCVGLVADDVLHRLMLKGGSEFHGMSRHCYDLFRYASGDPEAARGLMNAGIFPWWTDPKAVLAFFRPISSWTHWLDYQAWPDSPWLMHLHSLAWFLLLLWVVALIYRRFENNRQLAVLALFMFALDDARGPVVAWLANRNMIVSLALALPALLAHDQWRSKRDRKNAWLGPFALALGLLAGEAALVVVAYLVAYALFLDRASWRSRVSSLVPYAAEVLVWRLVYNRLGYGSIGSGIYLDPGRQPFDFAAAAATRLPVLLLGEFAFPWSDAWEVYPLVAPGLRGVVFVLAIAVITALIWLLSPFWIGSRVFRFWATGSLLATVPICATFPHDRLLMGPGIGGMAMLAHLFLAPRHGNGRLRSRLATISISGLAAIHLVLGPALLPYRTYALREVNQMLGRAYESIPSSVDIAPKSVVLINPPIDPFATYFAVYREASQQQRPKHVLWLANGTTELRITRMDARTLSVQPKNGLWSNSTQLMLRSLERPVPLGPMTALDEASFEVTALTEDGIPSEILVRFKRDLDAAEFDWLQWGTHGYVRFHLPAPGVSVTVPAVNLRAALFG